MSRSNVTEKLLLTPPEDLPLIQLKLPGALLLRRKLRLICFLLIVFTLSLITYLVIFKGFLLNGPFENTLKCPIRKPRDISVLREQTNCNVVPVNSTDFQVFTCESKWGCHSGYVLIKRNDEGYCRMSKKADISPDPSYTELFHTLDGPDTFYVNFTGAEKYAIYQWAFDESCAYKFPYQFTNAGEVSLEIIHVYQDYDGVNEVLQRWPPYLASTLITNHKMVICPECPTVTIDVSLPDTLPPITQECDREVSTPGSWLPVDSNTSVNISTSGYVWTPLGCQYPDTHIDTQCLQNNRSILFFGDSQIRVMYENLWRRLEGMTDRVPTLNKFLDMNKVIENVSLWHHKDMFLEDIVTRNDSYLMNFDTIVFNFAQWPASGTVFGGHWTTERFLTTLNNVTDFLLGVQNRRPKEQPLRLIWQGVHAFSMKNIYSEKRGDWRTLARLKNWNRLAEDLVRSKGIRTMNSFEITYSMLDTSPDNAHYFGTDAEEAVVNEVIHKLDLCTSFP